MKAAQVPKPGAEFQLVERGIPAPSPGQVRIKVQACGVCHSDASPRKAPRPASSIPASPDTRWRASSTRSVPAFSDWKKGQRVGVGWHGGHDGTCRECRRGDFGIAETGKFPASATTAATRNTWWLPSRRWSPFRTRSVTSKRRRCSAPASPPTTPCGTAAHCPAIWSRCRASAGWAISAFSSRASSVTGSRPSVSDRKARPREQARRERVHRQQGDEPSRGAARTGWRTGHTGDCPKLESHVASDRRFGAERQAHGDRCCP